MRQFFHQFIVYIQKCNTVAETIFLHTLLDLVKRIFYKIHQRNIINDGTLCI